MRYVTSSKLLNLTAFFFFKMMEKGYVTFENDSNYVSSPKLEQLICEGIFPGYKKYIWPTKVLTDLELHRSNVWNQKTDLKSGNIQGNMWSQVSLRKLGTYSHHIKKAALQF